MGSYYTSCPNCGDEIAGRWGADDDYDSQEEPSEVTERRIEHYAKCHGSFRTGAAVVCGMILMGEAIRRSQQWVASRREKVGKEKRLRAVVQA